MKNAAYLDIVVALQASSEPRQRSCGTYTSWNETGYQRLMNGSPQEVSRERDARHGGVTLHFCMVAQSLIKTIFLAIIRNRKYSHTTVRLDAT
jgi:hypothetical protein